MAASLPKFLTVTEMAQETGVLPEAIRIWIREGLAGPGKLTAMKIGQQWVVLENVWQEFLKDRG